MLFRMDKAIDRLERIAKGTSVRSMVLISRAPESYTFLGGQVCPDDPSHPSSIGIATALKARSCHKYLFLRRKTQSQSESRHQILFGISWGCLYSWTAWYELEVQWLCTQYTLYTGTGKTHTLIELIRQLTTVTPSNPKSQRLLVCGASNLSVDNILERLLALPTQDGRGKLKVTRIGHPARVMAHQGILDNTLEVQATRSDQVWMNLALTYCAC